MTRSPLDLSVRNSLDRLEHSDQTSEHKKVDTSNNLSDFDNGRRVVFATTAKVPGSIKDSSKWRDDIELQGTRPPLRRPASNPIVGGSLTARSSAANGKKRNAPGDLEIDQAPSKRTKLRLGPQRISDLPKFSRPSKPDDTAVSPLFFSHTPRQRPPLPRFSSSDAGAAMMKKVNVEDGSNPDVIRTVKLARRSMGLSPSQRTIDSPSERYLGDRQSASRLTSPEEKDHAAHGLKAISQVGVLELLEQDDRLIFIIDLANSLNFQPGPLQIVFVNSTLKAYGLIYDIIRGKILDDSISIPGAAALTEFKAWATSFVLNEEAMDVALPVFAFSGVTWTCSSIRRKFRIFYGSPAIGASAMSSAQASVRASAIPPASEQSNQSELPMDKIDTAPMEPLDYFGDLAQPINDSTHTDSAMNETVVSSIETPQLPMKSLGQPNNKSSLNIDLSTSANQVESTRIQSSSKNTSETPRPVSADDMFSPLSSDLNDQGFFDWTRLPLTQALPRHIQFARSIDWAATSLGPIDAWSPILRSISNLLMASPHPAAMYWGEDNVALYNEPYILLAGKKHPNLMGQTYRQAWGEIWEELKDVFLAAKLTAQSTMKDDDRLFVNRLGFLEETYFSWSLIPIVGPDGKVIGLFNPAFEKTRRKIAERRMLTLRDVGETTATAREVKGFWPQVLKGLEYNHFDTPFVLLYSIADEGDSDASSMHSNSILGARSCVLEGTLPEIPDGHPIAPATIDLKTGVEGFGAIFREAMTMEKPVLLETANGTLDSELLEGFSCRGFPEKPRAAIVSPIHPTTGDSIIGFLVMGVNPRRPYDDDYSLFIQLLSRQLATSMAAVVLFEEEIRRGQRAAKLAALDRIELSEQLAARTKEALESETKFTRMAELAPVGMFIADREGEMIFTNDTFHAISNYPKESEKASWMDFVKQEDAEKAQNMWKILFQKRMPAAEEFRFKTPWEDPNGASGDTWVLASAYPEKDGEGNLKAVFGSITDISQQKWAQDLQEKRTAEAVELKRQQSNFIDMTSHEMRNPLSAILQCADEISGSLLEFKANAGNFQVPISLLDSNIDAAQTIALCANHQTRIVSDVLTLSKLDSALLLVTPVDVRPTNIVQQALKMFEGELHTADIKMEFKIHASLQELDIDWVRLDPSRLLQVLINLTTNAIKFTTNQTKRIITILLSASLEPPSQLSTTCVSYIPSKSKRNDVTNGKDWGTGENIFLNFSVEDTGKGLTDSEKKLLFLRFSQASPKTHVQYGGSGLGLFISRELVELQGGEIGVSSERGKGSTFAFYVKARKSSGSEDAANGVPATASLRKTSMNRSIKPTNVIKPTTSHEHLISSPIHKPLEHLKVLIVEDNLVNQRVLSKQLRTQGCVVNVANHGGECIEQLKKTKFWRGHENDGEELSVVLMDLEMPVMDGLTCTRTVRDLQAKGDIIGHVPIIAVSANARNAHIESALDAGMDDVVSKPFRIPELVPKMEQLVEKYKPPS